MKRTIVKVLPWMMAVFPLSACAAAPPGQLLDLSSWKLTLPVDVAKPLGSPDEIKSPELKNFAHLRYFFVENGAVIFRAPCGGATTKNSKYPRCELREMSADGTSRAAWDTRASLVRSMTLQASITKTPKVKRHVVCAQIHDADDDLMMVRLEGDKLFIERNKIGDVLLQDGYRLGDSFSVKIEAGKGRVKVWYNGELKMDWEVAKRGCYFKAGCYTQSNPEKGDRADDYGEVIISKLKLETQKNHPNE
ncbi:polysaccharide lyase family 7 protein [Verrucomicrobiaceae bacterium R5-34]|nr:polysaccharide lyase family 7 protein [Verrucomicrobiaceae bacterium R5-34]